MPKTKLKKPKLYIVYYGDSEVEINNADVFVSETGSEKDFMKFAEYSYGKECAENIEIDGIYLLSRANSPEDANGNEYKITLN